MITRKAIIEDLKDLTILFNEYRIFYKKDSDLKGATEFLRERISKNDSEIYVCELANEQLAGFTQLYPLFSSTKMKRLWLMNDLYVNAEFRGQGLSILLIERAKQLVIESNACGMYLETGITNEIGNKLYPRIGFTLNKSSNFYEWNYSD